MSRAAISHAPSRPGGAGAGRDRTSWDHYQALKAAAGGGVKKSYGQLPDWTGVWMRAGRFAGLNWDVAQPRGGRADA